MVVTAPSPLYVERKQWWEPSVGGIAEGSRNGGSDPKGSVGIDSISHIDLLITFYSVI